MDCSLSSFNSCLSLNSTEAAAKNEKGRKRSLSNQDGSNKKKFHLNEEVWENAVAVARGTPDGSETSGKLSKKKLHQAKEIKNCPSQRIKKKFERLQAKKLKKEEALRAEQEKWSSMTKKERKKEHRLTKNNHEIITTTNKMWEELRSSKTSKSKQVELCKNLCSLMKGKMLEIARSHDSSRVIQSVFKFGDIEHRCLVFDELRGEILTLAKSQYGCFVILKFLKYGTKVQRDYIMRCMNGKIIKMLRNKFSAVILDSCFNAYANAAQRNAMVQEFYGPSYILFKTPECKSLADIVLSQPEKRDSILSNMKVSLLALIDKEILDFGLIHRVLLEYFTHAVPNNRQEVIEALREHVVTMLNTTNGIRVAMALVWFGTAKDRKFIIKGLKDHVSKIACNEHAFLLLLAIFDAVDDTKLVSKVVIGEIMSNIEAIAASKYGRKVLFYLLSPRNTCYLLPDQIRMLEQGDGKGLTLKERSVRSSELLSAASPLFVTFAERNIELLVSQPPLLILLVEIINSSSSDVTRADLALCTQLSQPFSTDKGHLVDSSAGHWMLKKLVAKDAENVNQGKVALFTTLVLDMVDAEQIQSWCACNRGCFLLVDMIKIKSDDIRERLKSILLPMRKKLKKMMFTAAGILLEKLDPQDE